jgi:hypothetical protein
MRRLSAIEPAESTTSASHSAVVPAGGASSQSGGEVASAGFTAPSDYGYDPDYRWVRGKLEYSQIDRKWKLRYIPIDGETDAFGGSVVLSDAAKLEGCQRGDFLLVRGKPADEEAPKGFAPVYEVAEVERQTR